MASTKKKTIDKSEEKDEQLSLDMVVDEKPKKTTKKKETKVEEKPKAASSKKTTKKKETAAEEKPKKTSTKKTAAEEKPKKTSTKKTATVEKSKETSTKKTSADTQKEFEETLAKIQSEIDKPTKVKEKKATENKKAEKDVKPAKESKKEKPVEIKEEKKTVKKENQPVKEEKKETSQEDPQQSKKETKPKKQKKKVELTPTENSNIFIVDIEVPADTIKDVKEKEVAKKAEEAKKPTSNKTKDKETTKKKAAKKSTTKKATEKKPTKTSSKKKATKKTSSKKNTKKSDEIPAIFSDGTETLPELKTPYEEVDPAEYIDLADGRKKRKIKPITMPKALTWFIPMHNDSSNEVLRKAIVLICFVVLVCLLGFVVSTEKLKTQAKEENAGINFVTKYVYSYEIYNSGRED